jgi:signal peptidase I
MKYAPLFCAILFAVAIRIFFISVYKAPSNSMAPEILQGEHILASQLSFGFKSEFNTKTYFSSEPAIGNLVIYTKNTKSIIKRVLARPGDTIEYQNNQLSINGQLCQYLPLKAYASDSLENVKEICDTYPENYIIRSQLPLSSTAQRITSTKLESGQFLVGGDHRSFDGGLQVLDIINADQIVGKPLFVWMSYSTTQDFISPTLGMRWNRILTKLK